MPLVNPVAVFDFTVILMDATPTSALTGVLGGAAGVASAALTGTFAEVSGLNAEMETEEYREGGRNTGPRKFVKWAKYPNLVCKRGVTPNTDLWDWYYQVLYGDQSVLRKNGIVVLTDRTAAGATGAVGWAGCRSPRGRSAMACRKSSRAPASTPRAMRSRSRRWRSCMRA
jgi:phage tail-like protein